MGIVVRQSIKGTVVVYLGVVLAFIINLVIFPLCFSINEIGLLRVLAELGTLIATFASLGFTQSAFKFFPYFNNTSNGHNGYLTLLTFFPFLGILLFSISLIVFKEPFIAIYQKDSPLLSSYWYLIIPVSLGMMYSTLYEYYSNFHLRIVVPKIIRELLLRFSIIGTAFFVYYNIIDFTQFSWLYSLLFIFSAVLILIYIRQLNQLHFVKINFNPEYNLKQISVFNGYILLGGLGSLLINQIDILMIAASPGGDANNGIYLTMVLIASMIELPGRSLAQISTPIIADYMKNNNYGEVKSMYRNTSIIQLSVGCLLFTLLWANIDNVFAMMPKGQLFQAGKWCVFYIGISQLFNMSTSVNGTILGLSKYYKFGFFATLGLGVISFCTNYLLISRYSIEGAAMAKAINIFLYQLAILFYVYFKMGMQPFTGKTILPIVIMIIGFGASWLLPALEYPLVDIAVRSAVIILVFVSLSLWFNVSPYYKELVNKGLSKLGLKK